MICRKHYTILCSQAEILIDLQTQNHKCKLKLLLNLKKHVDVIVKYDTTVHISNLILQYDTVGSTFTWVKVVLPERVNTKYPTIPYLH